MSVVILLAGITFDSVYIIRATRTKFLITWTTIGIVVMANIYLFAMVGRELWIAGHKKQAKTKFLWKSLKLQRNHVAHKMMLAQGRASDNKSILMQRMRAKRGLLQVEKMNKDIEERNREVATHKAELEKMKAMVKKMEADHADGLEEAKQKMEDEKARVAAETRDLAERRASAAAMLAETRDDTASHEEEVEKIQRQAAQHKAAQQKKQGLRRAKSQRKLKDRLAARKSLAMAGVTSTTMSMRQLSKNSHIQRKLSNTNLSQEQFEGALLLSDDEDGGGNSPGAGFTGMQNVQQPQKSVPAASAFGSAVSAQKDGGAHHHHHHKKGDSKKKHSKKKKKKKAVDSDSSSSSSSDSDSDGESFDL